MKSSDRPVRKTTGLPAAVSPASAGVETQCDPRRSIALVFLLAIAVTFAAPGLTSAQTAPTVDLKFGKVIDGLDRPVAMLDSDDGTGRFFVVEQPGRVVLLKDGKLLAQPFLDISTRVGTGSEQGLLSIALHPDFAKNGEFFIDYTDTGGNSQIERWTVSKGNVNVADPASAVTLLTVDQPYANHNGGLLLFGPDGKLYIGFGDGGSQGDPHGNGQNLDVLLGKILRIDVDTTTGDLPYGIPADNPFAKKEGARGEIWVYGVRNPWRFSFDKKTGDLFIGDAGQDTYEEADFAPAGTGGLNFGWNIVEAAACYQADSCDKSGITPPFFFYSHSDGGCSITGGYIYRGTAIDSLAGVYLAADYCSGSLWEVHLDGKGGSNVSGPISTGMTPSSFAQDSSGELYIIDLQGAIYKITG
jgi:glucose/arabinose dehydrogenase